MNRILSFFLICYVLLQSAGNIMANPIQVRPLPIPIDESGQQPIPLPHPVDSNPIQPLTPPKLKIHSEIGLLLIEDEVTSLRYVTTLDSRGNRMAGSSTQTIFGFPQPTGQMKAITWYTHGANMDVQHISELTPAEAFAGVTDAHGTALLQGNSGLDIPPAGPVNPVFSPKAWDEFSKMPVGGTHAIAVTEQLTNGGERRLDTLVAKRAHLRLSQAVPDCKPETVDGMDGQVCTLRTIAGQHQATSAGDMRFTLRALSPVVSGRFRIANNWHHLGEPVTIAEFANGRTLDLFIPSSLAREGAPTLPMAQRFEAQFFSLSRQGMGDKLTIQMDRHNSVAPQPPVLGRADLLLIEDLPTARQYVTTLGSSGQQRIYGELNGTQGVKWYTTFQQGVSGMNPLVRVSQLQPANYFKGIANGIGQLSPSVVRPTYEKGYIFPVFSDQAFSALTASAMGQQQRLSLQGEYESGASAPYYLNVNKKSHIKLQMPANNHCTATEVDGAKGFICPLRAISGQGDYNGTGDLRFNLSAKLPFALQQHARYRVGQAWHPVNQSITMAEFGNGQVLELFVPQDEHAYGVVIGVQGNFHSASQMSDSFNIAMRTRLSPVVGIGQRVNVIAIHDEPTQQSLLATADIKGVEIAGVVGDSVSAPAIKLKGMPGAQIQSVTPAQWFADKPDVERKFTDELKLSSNGITRLLQGGQLSAQIKAMLHDGQRVDYALDVQAAQPLVLSQGQGQCRAETLEGVPGQVCELRHISGRAMASDMRFLVSAKLPYALQQQARYQVGDTWHPLGESISLAELASGQAISLFVPQGENATTTVTAVQAEVYSSKQRAQRIMISMNTPLNPALKSTSPQQLVVVEDQPTNKTLFAPVLAANTRLADSAAVTVAGGAKPLVGLTGLPGANIQSMTPQGLLTPAKTRQQTGPLPLSAEAVTQLLQKGQLQGQVTVALPDGSKAEYPLDIDAGQHLRLTESQGACQPETVNGVQGQSCEWRQLSGEIKQSDVRFRVTADGSIKEALYYKVGSKWNRIGDDISINEFSGQSSLSLFIPDQLDRKLHNGQQITGEFFSGNAVQEPLTIAFTKPDAEGELLIVEDFDFSANNISVGESVTVTVKLRHPPGNDRVQRMLNLMGPSDSGLGCAYPKLIVSDPVGAVLLPPKPSGLGSRFKIDQGRTDFSYKLSINKDVSCERSITVTAVKHDDWQSKVILVHPKDQSKPTLDVKTAEASYPTHYDAMTANDEIHIKVTLNRPAEASDEYIYIVAPNGSNPYSNWGANGMLLNEIKNLTNANYISGNIHDGIAVSVKPGASEFHFNAKLRDYDIAKSYGEIFITKNGNYPYKPDDSAAHTPHTSILFRTNSSTNDKLSVIDIKSDNDYHEGYVSISYLYANQSTRFYIKLNRPAKQGEQVNLTLYTAPGGIGEAEDMSGEHPGLHIYAITPEVFGVTSVPVNGVDSGAINLPICNVLNCQKSVQNTLTVTEGVSELSFELLPLSIKKYRVLTFRGTLYDSEPVRPLLTTYLAEGEGTSSVLKVTDISPNKREILPGEKVTYTVRLNKSAEGDEPINLRFSADTAGAADLASRTITDVQGASVVQGDIIMGAQVKMAPGSNEFTFSLVAKEDDDSTDETFTVSASESTVTLSSPSAEVVIKGKQLGALEVQSVTATPETIGENEFTKIEVTLNRPASNGEALFVKRSGGSADPDAVDPYVEDPQGVNGFGFTTAGASTAITSSGRVISFKLKALKSTDVDKTFDVFVKVDGATDVTAKTATVTISQSLTDLAKVVEIKGIPGSTIVAGDKQIVVRVSLDKTVSSPQPVYVKFDGKGDADIDDLTSPKMQYLSGATNPVANLADGGYVLVKPGFNSFAFEIAAKGDQDTAIEEFDIRAIEGTSDDPAAKFLTIQIIPRPTSPAKVMKVEAIPQQVEVGKTTRLSVQLDKPALGTEKIYVKMLNITTQREDILTPYIFDDSNLVGATGHISDLYFGGEWLTANKDATKIEFDLVMATDDDPNEESFLVMAQDGRDADTSSPNVEVNILPIALTPEISFTSNPPEKSGVFGSGEPDIEFEYGIELINYRPSANESSKTELTNRLLRALSITVDVSNIDSYNVEGKNYCTFKTYDSKLVPFPFYLRQENLNETAMDCVTATSLPLSKPEEWTGVHTGTTYHTTLKARVVMSDGVSANASGQPWHGTASLNGTLTLNMQAK